MSDRFPDPFHVLEQIPFGVEKDEQSMVMPAATVDWNNGGRARVEEGRDKDRSGRE